MTLSEAMQSVDMAEIIDGLNAYAIFRLKSVGLKNFNGMEPIDFVGDILLKVMEGERDWLKAKCSFKEFLFGSLRSAISNFFKSEQNIHLNEMPIISISDNYGSIDEKRKIVSELLEQAGADYDELTVFEYWMDGIYKPSEIALDLGVSPADIYNIIKRLERRLLKIQNQVIGTI